jgi:hypothetical protein
MELEIKASDSKIDIDLSPLQLTLVFEHENQADISAARFHELDAWIDAVKKSQLFPLIQRRYLKMHIRGHASKTGAPLANMDLSIRRRKNVQTRLEAMIDAPVDITPFDRGSKDASPALVKPNERDKAYLQDRNVTVYINEQEARSALQRSYMEANKYDDTAAKR